MHMIFWNYRDLELLITSFKSRNQSGTNNAFAFGIGKDINDKEIPSKDFLAEIDFLKIFLSVSYDF